MRDYPPLNLLDNPNFIYSSDYISSLPMVPAYGLLMCVKLAQDDPERAFRNADNVAGFALSKSDSNPKTHQLKEEKMFICLNSSSLPG